MKVLFWTKKTRWRNQAAIQFQNNVGKLRNALLSGNLPETSRTGRYTLQIRGGGGNPCRCQYSAGILSQNERPVALDASRSRTNLGQLYSQRGCISSCLGLWAFQHLSVVRHSQSLLITVPCWLPGANRHPLPRLIVGLYASVQPDAIAVQYKPGKDNPAEYVMTSVKQKHSF